MGNSPRDLTPLPDLLHGAALAGPVRTRIPVYTDLLPPCNGACPAGENIQAYLASTRAGEHERAWRQLTADNPFPAIHGRVCYHPCESSCNRAELDSSVSIHSVERFLGDLALDRGWQFDPPPARTGKRALVIGAGPSGLSAAYHLARRGHEVEIRDAGAEPGGMMRYGIPAYRLPRDVMAAELARIEALGVRMTCGHRVTDLVTLRADPGGQVAFSVVGQQERPADMVGHHLATGAVVNRVTGIRIDDREADVGRERVENARLVGALAEALAGEPEGHRVAVVSEQDDFGKDRGPVQVLRVQVERGATPPDRPHLAAHQVDQLVAAGQPLQQRRCGRQHTDVLGP